MPSDYTFAKPDVALDEGIYAFLEEFYRITDDPEGHDLYTQQYTPDGTAIMATFKCKGTEEIRDFRQRMWDRVKARKHKIHRVFAAAPGSPEIMLYGEVKQTLRSGGDLVKEWAAHGVLEKSAEDGKICQIERSWAVASSIPDVSVNLFPSEPEHQLDSMGFWVISGTFVGA
uniref:SnoaL-like domain-containing protein n=1 Tax=Pyricularia oryzae (strain P131) TaxID=1143193 RepID=L7JBP6_PYRO1